MSIDEHIGTAPPGRKLTKGHWSLQTNGDYVVLPSDDPEWQRLQFMAAICIGKAGHRAGFDEYQIGELLEILGLEMPTGVVKKEAGSAGPRGEVG